MPNKFKPMKTRFRATFSGDQLGETRLGTIDTENEILHDVQITLEGEALGHGVWLDREFCEAVAAAGNATGDVGLKIRYGHPAMCSDAIGTELARAKNFRVVEVEREFEGKKHKCAGVVADIHLLKSAHDAPQGDIVAHVMSVAAEDPKQFGQSIVFTYADWVVKDADGNRHSYYQEVVEGVDVQTTDGKTVKQKKSYSEWLEQSADGKEYAVLGKLHGSDFTDSPAATDGIFSTGTLAEEAETMLDEHPQIFDAIEKSPKSVIEFLERMGLDKKIESARVAGLQAAKDKEISEIRASFEDYKKRSAEALAAADEQAKAQLKAKDEELAAETSRAASLATQVTQFEADIAEKTTELESVKTENEQLKSKLGEATKALSDTKAALEVEIERYRAQVGAALQQPNHKQTFASNTDRIASGMRIV